MTNSILKKFCRMSWRTVVCLKCNDVTIVQSTTRVVRRAEFSSDIRRGGRWLDQRNGACGVLTCTIASVYSHGLLHHNTNVVRSFYGELFVEVISTVSVAVTEKLGRFKLFRNVVTHETPTLTSLYGIRPHYESDILMPWIE